MVENMNNLLQRKAKIGALSITGDNYGGLIVSFNNFNFVINNTVWSTGLMSEENLQSQLCYVYDDGRAILQLNRDGVKAQLDLFKHQNKAHISLYLDGKVLFKVFKINLSKIEFIVGSIYDDERFGDNKAWRP